MGIDTAEVVLLFVLVTLALLLLILGVQVFFILREFRQTVSKANRVLDQTSVITRSVSGPLSSLSSISEGVKGASGILAVVKLVKGILSDPDDEKRKK